MQSCTADNITNNHQSNISPIWRKFKFIFSKQHTVSPMAQLVIGSASLEAKGHSILNQRKPQDQSSWTLHPEPTQATGPVELDTPS